MGQGPDVTPCAWGVRKEDCNYARLMNSTGHAWG